MANPPQPMPQVNLQWVQKDGRPALVLQLYAPSLDSVVRALAAGVLGPFVNAANDGAAAAAGVPINGLYRNGNAVQIRLV